MQLHSNQAIQHDVLVDAKGMACPIPLLMARLQIKRMETGQVLLVEATDVGTQRDFRSFAASANHEVIRETAADGEFRFWLRIRTLKTEAVEPDQFQL
ncbi:sulfurtransferase TusA family protein [Pseudomonas sp. NCHU5208]|uniref:sulfurtransferase TusA family protein n=1 Tax=unclassified Pseudomonas TaxID=196821 RepID=UPI003F9B8DD1